MVKYSTETMPDLDAVFSALSDPVRRGMLERLSKRPTQVTELAAHFPISLPAVSKHVGVLERAGLIRRQKEGRIHHLSLQAEPLRKAQTYLQAYREFWERNLDALARLVEDPLSQSGNGPSDLSTKEKTTNPTNQTHIKEEK